MNSKPLNLQSDVVELTAELCNIESVSGNETQLANLIFDALGRYLHLELLRDGDAIIARTNLGRSSRVIIAGHIDTVPIADNLPVKLLPMEREQVLWGRGTVDMKAGVAVQLKLAATITEPNVDVTWVFYDHEEVAADLNGLGRLVANYPHQFKADFAVLCEPTAAFVEGGCNGTLRFEIITSGVKAHSARPWMGKNAIHAQAQALTILANFVPEEIEVDGLTYRESLNAVLTSGGIATNVIPDQAVLTVNYRFAPDKTAQQAAQKMRELFSDFSLNFVDLADGARPGLDQEPAQRFLAAIGLAAKPKYGWTDVARFSALGIPAVNYGPGDPSKAHADDEHVPVRQIYECEAGLREWLTA